MIKRLKLVLFVLLAIGCADQTHPEAPEEIYPVDRAHEDGEWTVLERVMPWGEALTFLVPNWWMPSNLRDHHVIKVDVLQGQHISTITFSLIEP